MVKALVFAEAPQPVKKESGPKPLSFPSTSTSSTQTAPQPPVVKPVSFPAAAQQQRPVANPKPLFGESASPLSADAIKTIQQKSPDLFAAHKQKFELYVSRLLPIKLEIVMDWGSKTMERSRIAANEAAKLTSEFVSFDGLKILDAALKSVQPATGLLGKFKRQKPTDFEPQIAVLMTSLSTWMQTCNTLIARAKQNLEDVLLKSVSLASVCETVGDPADQILAQTMHNRRVMLQQGATQAELVLRQLESIYQQMVDQRMRADQMLNVTIPAWKNAAANK